MAYKKSETQKILADIKKNDRGDYIRVSIIQNDKDDTDVSYDIRNMYTNDDGELAFTSKGVRVKSEIMVEILEAILTNLDADTYNDLVSKVIDLDDTYEEEGDTTEEDDTSDEEPSEEDEPSDNE